MWQVLYRKYGEEARPTEGIGLEEYDVTRFAKFVLINKTHNIKMSLNMYLPIDTSTCTELIFSIHGMKRNASKYRNIFVPYLKDKNVLVVAPSFTDTFYEDSNSLKMGNICKGTKNPVFLPKSEWSFTHIYEIFLLLKNEFLSLKTFSMFGHSAGAQFVHRMVIFSDYKEMRLAVAANAGWYTSLDSMVNFPYGIGGVCDTEQIKRILGKKLVLAVGEKDVELDTNLRVTDKTLEQGENRLDRAKNIYAVAQRRALDLKTKLNWELVVIPGVGHSSRLIVPAVTDYLF